MFRHARSTRRGGSAGPHIAAVVAAITLMSMVGIQPAEATAGAELWVARTPAEAYFLDDVAGVAMSPDGSRVFVAGSAYASTGNRFQTVAYDASGVQLWSRRHGGGGAFNDRLAGIGVSPDGSMVFVT